MALDIICIINNICATYYYKKLIEKLIKKNEKLIENTYKNIYKYILLFIIEKKIDQ